MPLVPCRGCAACSRSGLRSLLPRRPDRQSAAASVAAAAAESGAAPFLAPGGS